MQGLALFLLFRFCETQTWGEGCQQGQIYNQHLIPDKLLLNSLKAQRFGRIAALRICFVFFFNWIYMQYVHFVVVHSMDTFYICIHVNYMICKLVKYRQIHIRFTSLKQACSRYGYCIIHCTIYYTSYSGPAHFLIRVIFFPV